ncbi:hypothetical protein [Flavobacterium sp.]|uniref:hypothetical protein n=1 Tax=Flavobacterium sp. TaxID=239 RepID=UPI0037526297
MIIVIFFFISCTDRNEKEYRNYSVEINNSTSVGLTIEGYNSENNLIINNSIESNSIGAECNYQAEIFSGYICGADSIVIKFSNGKGYICDLRESGNILCLPSKFIFSEQGFINLNNNNYQFVITEDDYNNAYVLP